MNQKIEDLRAWGCDVTGAMRRMLNDEEFYIDCLETIPGDENLEKLINALKSKNVTAAFDSSHTLKGLYANMGLIPMYNKDVEIVEPLRAGNGDNLDEKLKELLEMNEHLKLILGMK